jgi:ferritin-like metal-binding protein YciE
MSSNREKNREIRENINITLDETKSSVHKTAEEAKKQVPQLTKAVNEYQEQSIQATKDIADNFLESQKEVINSVQSLWVPYMKICKISTGRIGCHPIGLLKIIQEQLAT